MTTTRDLIEQARARGWTIERTAAEIAVTQRTVERVWREMDLAIAQQDDERISRFALLRELERERRIVQANARAYRLREARAARDLRIRLLHEDGLLKPAAIGRLLGVHRNTIHNTLRRGEDKAA